MQTTLKGVMVGDFFALPRFNFHDQTRTAPQQVAENELAVRASSCDSQRIAKA